MVIDITETREAKIAIRVPWDYQIDSVDRIQGVLVVRLMKQPSNLEDVS